MPTVLELPRLSVKDYRAQRRLQRKAAGLCMYCGKRSSRPEAYSCGECAREQSRVNSRNNMRRACRQADAADNRGLITIDEAARILGVSVATVQRQIRLGRLVRTKVARVRRGYVKRSAVMALRLVRCSAVQGRSAVRVGNASSVP